MRCVKDRRYKCVPGSHWFCHDCVVRRVLSEENLKLGYHEVSGR